MNGQNKKVPLQERDKNADVRAAMQKADILRAIESD